MSDLSPIPPDLAVREAFAAFSPAAAKALEAVAWVWPRLPESAGASAWGAWLSHQVGPHAELAVELRRARRLATAALLFNTYVHGDTRAFGASLAGLVEATLTVGLQRAELDLRARYGQPQRLDGKPPTASILAFGPLANRFVLPGEAATLLFVHDADQGIVVAADGQRQPFELHLWFVRLFQRLVAVVEDRSGDALSLPLELGLRPEGGRGALCNSIDALEAWYEGFGDPRERLAWTGARGVAGDDGLAERVIATLRPFVFRRTIDEGVAHEIAALKRDVGSTAACTPAAALRRGLFVVQVMQLVWGGRVAGLRTADPFHALAKASEAGLVAPHEATALADAIGTVHRAAVVAAARPLDVIADSDDIIVAVAYIQTLFDGLAHTAAMPPIEASLDADCMQVIEVSGPAEQRLAAASRLGFLHPEGALGIVDAMCRRPHGPFHLRLRSEGGTLGTLAHRVLLACRESLAPDESLRHFEALFRVIEHRRQALQQLADDPQRLRVVANLFASSPSLSRMLVRAPGLIDRLLLEGREPPTRDRRALDAIVADEIAMHGPDWEGALAAVRRVHAAETLRIGFFDLTGTLDAAEVAQQLSFLAEAIIRALFDIARRDLEERCDCNLSGVSVLARGALASRALGYHPRLDLVFLYGADVEPAMATRLVRMLVTGLSCATPEGLLYSVETRPPGSGPVGVPCIPTTRFLEFHRTSTDLRDALNLLGLRVLLGPVEVARQLETLRTSRIGNVAPGAIGDLVRETLATVEERPLAAAERIVRHVQLTLHGPPAAQARADHAAGDVMLGRAIAGLGELGVWRDIGDVDARVAFVAAIGFLRRLYQRRAIIAEHAGESGAGQAIAALGPSALRRLALRLGYRADGDNDPVAAMRADEARHVAAIAAVAKAMLERLEMDATAHVGPAGEPA